MFEKLQKAKGSRNFLKQCQASEVKPTFCNVPTQSKAFFSKRQIRSAETQKLQKELEQKNTLIIELSSTLSYIYTLLKPLYTSIELSQTLTNLTTQIKHKLKIPDLKRSRKLKNLVEKTG